MFFYFNKQFVKDLIDMKDSAYRLFYSLYYEQLVKYSMSIVKNVDDAEDVVCDMITGLNSDLKVALLNNKDIFSYSKMKKWLIANVRNKAYRLLDNNIKKSEREMSLEEYHNIAKENMFSYELMTDIHLIFNSEERELFMLKYYHELRIKDISEILNISESIVKRKLIIIKEIMVEYLGGYDEKY